MDYYFNYDKEADVLYINVGNKPQKADSARCRHYNNQCTSNYYKNLCVNGG